MKAGELESSRSWLKVPYPHTLFCIELDNRSLTAEVAPLGRESSRHRSIRRQARQYPRGVYHSIVRITRTTSDQNHPHRPRYPSGIVIEDLAELYVQTQ